MIKSLRRKFIITAMLSLSILIVILISGVALLGYYQMEQTADSMLLMLSGERMPAESGSRLPFPAFGYQISPSRMPTGYFEAFVTDDGQVLSINNMSMTEITEEEVVQHINNVLAKGNTEGKVGSYKYIIIQRANRPSRIVFLDISLQVQTLIGTISASLLVGLGCMVLMFVILFFVSGRVISPVARNIEKQQQFVSNAGHEIKTPLGIIMANTDAMELHLGENKWSKNIRSQTERMNGLMNGLLLLARMDEVAKTIPFETVNLSNTLEKVNMGFGELAKGKQIQVQTKIEDNITVQGNPDNLEELISILLDNAIKYTNDGGDIIIRLTAEGRKNKLIVENSIETLPDVPPATLFDRFYRASVARTQKDGGYGIGLSAARAIAQIHGGKIEASYIGNHRIRFAVELY